MEKDMQLVNDKEGLQRLQITSHRAMDCTDAKISTFIAQVNPEKLDYSFGLEAVGSNSGNSDNDISGGAGQSARPEGFKSYNKMDLIFDLHADATGILPIPNGLDKWFRNEKGQPSIRLYLNKLQHTVYGYEPEIHGPPYLKLVWGKVFPDTSNKKGERNPPLYKGMLKQCDVSVKLFSFDGEPIKASIKLTLKSMIDPMVRPLGASPDLTHYYNISEGDKMTNYCQRIYGRYDTNICAAVAAYNGLVDWELKGGQKIMFPSIHLLEESYLPKYERVEPKSILRMNRRERMEQLVGKKRANQYFNYQNDLRKRFKA